MCHVPYYFKEKLGWFPISIEIGTCMKHRKLNMGDNVCVYHPSGMSQPNVYMRLGSKTYSNAVLMHWKLMVMKPIKLRFTMLFLGRRFTGIIRGWRRAQLFCLGHKPRWHGGGFQGVCLRVKPWGRFIGLHETAKPSGCGHHYHEILHRWAILFY